MQRHELSREQQWFDPPQSDGLACIVPLRHHGHVDECRVGLRCGPADDTVQRGLKVAQIGNVAERNGDLRCARARGGDQLRIADDDDLRLGYSSVYVSQCLSNGRQCAVENLVDEGAAVLLCARIERTGVGRQCAHTRGDRAREHAVVVAADHQGHHIGRRRQCIELRPSAIELRGVEVICGRTAAADIGETVALLSCHDVREILLGLQTPKGSARRERKHPASGAEAVAQIDVLDRGCCGGGRARQREHDNRNDADPEPLRFTAHYRPPMAGYCRDRTAAAAYFGPGAKADSMI